MMASSSSGAASPHATATQATIKPAHAICRLAICRIILLDMYAATATQATSKPVHAISLADMSHYSIRHVCCHSHAGHQQAWLAGGVGDHIHTCTQPARLNKLRHRQQRREEGPW